MISTASVGAPSIGEWWRSRSIRRSLAIKATSGLRTDASEAFRPCPPADRLHEQVARSKSEALRKQILGAGGLRGKSFQAFTDELRNSAECFVVSFYLGQGVVSPDAWDVGIPVCVQSTSTGVETSEERDLSPTPPATRSKSSPGTVSARVLLLRPQPMAPVSCSSCDKRDTGP